MVARLLNLPGTVAPGTRSSLFIARNGITVSTVSAISSCKNLNAKFLLVDVQYLF